MLIFHRMTIVCLHTLSAGDGISAELKTAAAKRKRRWTARTASFSTWAVSVSRRTGRRSRRSRPRDCRGWQKPWPTTTQFSTNTFSTGIRESLPKSSITTAQANFTIRPTSAVLSSKKSSSSGASTPIRFPFSFSIHYLDIIPTTAASKLWPW